MMHGVVVCILPLISNPIDLYIVIAIIGGITGAVFGFKGNLLAHLYPTKDIAYVYGLTEAAGGLGALTIPSVLDTLKVLLDMESVFTLSVHV